MESIIERQAIRTAVALAAASSHGQSPEVIADLRDEAVNLIGLCVHASSGAEEIRVWCDGATALVTRLVSTGSIPEEQVLQVSAAVLRLRLASARASSALEKKSHSVPTKKAEEPRPAPVKLGENQRKVVDFLAEHPGIRAKDLVVALGATFSPRSVKRYLAELASLNVIRRSTLEDGGVAYSVRT